MLPALGELTPLPAPGSAMSASGLLLTLICWMGNPRRSSLGWHCLLPVRHIYSPPAASSPELTRCSSPLGSTFSVIPGVEQLRGQPGALPPSCAWPGWQWWQEHQDFWLEEEKELHLPWQCCGQELLCPCSQGRVSSCFFAELQVLVLLLHVFPGLLGLMAKLLVSPRDFLNPSLPGALSQESRACASGCLGSAGEPVVFAFAAFCKAQRCQYSFHRKAQKLS